MNYGELQTQFEGLLKRRDLTTTQRDTWLQMAISRCQRKLRVPAMEKSVQATFISSMLGEVAVPGDLLQLKALCIEASQVDLTQRTLREVLAARVTTGTPEMYVRRGTNYVLGPYPTDGTAIRMDYYAELDPLADPLDENFLSAIAPDAIVYGALSLACDWFIDKRAATFEGRFEQFLQELQDQADQDELLNASMRPALPYPDCE